MFFFEYYELFISIFNLFLYRALLVAVFGKIRTSL